MPLYALSCLNGHTKDEYCPTPADKGCRTHVCAQCREAMAHVLSLGKGLTYFGEGESRTIANMGHTPVTITSYQQHEAAMKQHGVRLLPPRYGEKGAWV